MNHRSADAKVTSSGRALAILGLHKVGEPSPGGWETWYYNTEAEFEGYLVYLKQSEWTVLDVHTLLNGLDSPESLPRRSVLITFDDGYRSVHETALPLLLRYGMPAVVFAVSGCVGRGSHSFDANSREPDEPLCTWEELRELERHGISVQSHGETHHAFSELTPEEIHEEVVRSKREIEDALQKPVELFGFPYGDGGERPGEVSAKLERAGYRAACLYNGRVNPLPVPDRYRLSRVWLGRYSDLAEELGKAEAGGQATDET